AGDGEQPGIGIVGDAIARPGGEGGGKRLAQRVLRACDVAGAGREEGDEAAIAVASNTPGSFGDLVIGCHFQLPVCSTMGRISIEPYLLEGQRLAQAMASSMSGAVTKK